MHTIILPQSSSVADICDLFHTCVERCPNSSHNIRATRACDETNSVLMRSTICVLAWDVTPSVPVSDVRTYRNVPLASSTTVLLPSSGFVRLPSVSLLTTLFRPSFSSIYSSIFFFALTKSLPFPVSAASTFPCLSSFPLSNYPPHTSSLLLHSSTPLNPRINPESHKHIINESNCFCRSAA